MDGRQFGRWTRRTFGLALGGVGAAFLRLSGSDEAGAKNTKKKRKAKATVGPNGPAGPSGPAGPVGPAGPGGPPGSVATRLVSSADSAPLEAAAGSLVAAQVACGGESTLLACAYTTNGIPQNAALFANVAVPFVSIDVPNAVCTVALLRTATAGSTAGAKIRADALCLA